MNDTALRRIADVVCPQCGWPFRLTFDSIGMDSTLNINICPSGGIYDVRIECPRCDYEEPL